MSDGPSDQQHLQRLAALGAMLAGVSHELNNVTTQLVLSLRDIDHTCDRIADGTSSEQSINQVRSSVKAAVACGTRLVELSRGVTQYSGRESSQRQVLELDDVLAQALQLVRHELDSRARITVELEQNLPSVLANQRDLFQVFINLLLNAAHAIEGPAQDNFVRITARACEQQVHVAVQDSGRGIPAEHRARIFEPFFTTRNDGGGTGLGLSICREIVAALDGTIDVQSEPGAGTTFCVSIPRPDVNNLHK